jgi:hypothetical protein
MNVNYLDIIFDSECKLAVKNFVPNFKNIFAENGAEASAV